MGRRGWKRIRRVAAAAGLAVVALASVLVTNALRMPSRQLAVDTSPSESLIDVDGDEVAAILVELLSVPSFSNRDRSKIDPEAFRELHELLERRFPQAHGAVRRETVGELSLLYHWEGRDPELAPILLMSHLDVVPIEESSRDEWVHSPDRGTLQDGYVWGRGALDVKCGIVGIMAAIEQLVADGFVPERSIYLAFGHDEEVGGNDGNAAIAEMLHERGIELAFVLDEGGAILDGVIPGPPGPVAFVAIAEKRPARLTLTARGTGGHGSMRSGTSAISNLAEAITRIDENPLPARLPPATETLLDYLGPEMPFARRVAIANRWLFGGVITRQFTRGAATNGIVRSTLNVTQIGTHTVGNQSATAARATVDVRLLPEDTIEDVRDHVLALVADLPSSPGESAVECEASEFGGRGHVSPVDCPEFLVLQRTIHEVFPEAIVAAGLTAVSTDTRWYYDVTENIYRFIPMRLTPEDMQRIHGINERIAIDNLVEIVRFYAQLIRNAASVPKAPNGHAVGPWPRAADQNRHSQPTAAPRTNAIPTMNAVRVLRLREALIVTQVGSDSRRDRTSSETM